MTEQVRDGTLNELCGKSILLRASLDYIDLIHEKGVYSKESQEQRELVERLRKELE